jgi:hypothetical protein
VAAAETADLVLHAALLVSPPLAGQAEHRLKHVVRAQRDEPVALHAATPLEHLRDSATEIVIAERREHTLKEVEGVNMALQERLLGLATERHREPGTRVAGPHQEHMHHRRLRAHDHLRLTPIDLALRARVGHQRHERLDLADPPPRRSDIPIDLTLRDLRAVLLDKALPDPPRGMPLLARRLQVTLKPLVDQRPIPPQPRRRPSGGRPLWRRHRIGQRMAHRPPMNPMTPRQRPDRQTLPREITPDRLELLHSAHSLRPSA